MLCEFQILKCFKSVITGNLSKFTGTLISSLDGKSQMRHMYSVADALHVLCG